MFMRMKSDSVEGSSRSAWETEARAAGVLVKEASDGEQGEAA